MARRRGGPCRDAGGGGAGCDKNSQHQRQKHAHSNDSNSKQSGKQGKQGEHARSAAQTLLAESPRRAGHNAAANGAAMSSSASSSSSSSRHNSNTSSGSRARDAAHKAGRRKGKSQQPQASSPCPSSTSSASNGAGRRRTAKGSSPKNSRPSSHPGSRRGSGQDAVTVSAPAAPIQLGNEVRPLSSLDNVWQPDTNLADAMAYVQSLPSGSLERDQAYNVVVLRFLPLIGRSSKHQGSAYVRKRFDTDFAVQHLVRHLKTSKNGTVLNACINSLCALSTHPGNVAPMCAAELHKPVLQAARMHIANQALVKLATATISNLALHHSTGPTLLKANVHTLCSLLLEEYPTSDVITECITTCLANLANARDPSVGRALVAHDLHATCINLLLQTQHTGIRYHIVLFLNNLSLHDENHGPLAAAGCLLAAVAALKASVHMPKFTECVLAMLARMLRGPVIDALPRPDTEDAIVAAMKQYPTTGPVQTYGCVSLLSLAAALTLRDRVSLTTALAVHAPAMVEGLVAACSRGDEHVVNAYVKLFDCDVNAVVTDTTAPSGAKDPAQCAGEGPRAMSRNAAAVAVGGARTPLLSAVMNGHQDTVKVLLANSAKPLVKEAFSRVVERVFRNKNADLRFRQMLCLEIVRQCAAADERGDDRLSLSCFSGNRSIQALIGKPNTPGSQAGGGDGGDGQVKDLRVGHEHDHLERLTAATQELRRRAGFPPDKGRETRGGHAVGDGGSRGTDRNAVARRMQQHLHHPQDLATQGWLDGWLLHIDNILLHSVFDACTGELMLLRAAALVIGSSLLAGLVVGAALILITTTVATPPT